jgi:hypothetical protein
LFGWGLAAAQTPNPPAKTTIAIDPENVLGSLASNGFDPKTLANVDWYTGRWPMISFIGGMAMGNRSEDLEFFYSAPFNWHSTVLDYVLEGGGRICGLRVHYRLPASQLVRSFLLEYHPYTKLGLTYHPSYICANGRRIWDYRKDKMQGTLIHVPFSVRQSGELVLDIVVDRDATPDTKGLAFRLFHLRELGRPGVAVDLADAEPQASGSPADKLPKFVFGLFPSGYDFWTSKGVSIADIHKNWKPNFQPPYPTDDVYTCPFIDAMPAKGAYHDFMIGYGGCNVAGYGATSDTFKSNPVLRGALSRFEQPQDGKRLLALDPKLKAFWFRGEDGDPPNFADVVKRTKQAAGDPTRVVAMYEWFPPSLPASHDAYERGSDLLIFKNEEDPQYNLFISMARGAGRTFDRPYGFYWEQTHYPFVSLDEKLDACLLYYLSGASWISAEAEDAPSFQKQIVADWVYPFVQAMRFAMVHPARGQSIVPIGIVFDDQDNWSVPYNPFGQMDTFRRYVEYDSATNRLICEPSFTHVFPWMPQSNPRQANWKEVGALGSFIDKLDVIQGYNLLDVFFPEYGDAFTAQIGRLLTGTPYGPVDFVDLDHASAGHLSTFGVLALLGRASLTNPNQLAKIEAAAAAGAQILVAAQDFSHDGVIDAKPLGLIFSKDLSPAQGAVSGIDEIFAGAVGKYEGKLFAAQGEGWQTVARVGDRPLVIRKSIGKGVIYFYLGQWVGQGGDALRPVLRFIGQRAGPVRFDKPDHRLEYVAYRKKQGAWIALFNYGDIVVGCDRLDPRNWRVQPPQPLCSTPTGAYSGTIEFRLAQLGLNPANDYAAYQVLGIDGSSFDQVISGQSTFEVTEIPSHCSAGVVTAKVAFDKRAEYVIAPKGKGKDVFFGKP